MWHILQTMFLPAQAGNAPEVAENVAEGFPLAQSYVAEGSPSRKLCSRRLP